MTFPTCYTPCLVSLSDKSDDDRRTLENSPNTLLLVYLCYRLYGRTSEVHPILTVGLTVNQVA